MNEPFCDWLKLVVLLPTDTVRKLNVHKTFRRRLGHLLNVLYTFNLGTVSAGLCLNSPKFWILTFSEISLFKILFWIYSKTFSYCFYFRVTKYRKQQKYTRLRLFHSLWQIRLKTFRVICTIKYKMKKT